MAGLLKNTVFLYLLQFSNYAFSLATLPYITRILGPESYGNLGFAMSFSYYFTLIIDFGFRLSGTKAVAENKDKKETLSDIVSSITYSKIILGILLLVLLIPCCLYIKAMRDNSLLLLLYLIFSIICSILPDYLYRGLENMKIITYRAIIMKAIFTVLIFVFLRKPSQIILIPLFQIFGEIAAFTWVAWDINKNLNLKFLHPQLKIIKRTMRESAPFFFSRIAASIYGVMNTTILGFLYPGSAVIGYYTSADKIRSVATSTFSPIADSFYPYMNRTKDLKKLFKVTFMIEIPIILFCVSLWIFADPICTLLFGEEFHGASGILKWMTPIIAITYPNFMLGFPALTALGKSNWANWSVEIASLNQFVGILALFMFFEVNAINLCILTAISELIVFLLRISIIIKSYYYE